MFFFLYCIIEVVEKVFNWCVKMNGFFVDYLQYVIIFSYEFLDDVSFEWVGFVMLELVDYEEIGLDVVMYKIKFVLFENVSK